MVTKPIPIDFNIDNILFDGKTVTVPKFVKAIVRISKVLAMEKRKLALMYPSYHCPYIPVIALGSYFHFMSERHSRTGIKILLVTKSADTVLVYQRLCNPFNNPFVDFIYSGYLSKKGYKRLKPYGSSRGSPAGRINIEHANIFIVRPGAVEDVLNEGFNLCIIEDCQKMVSKRYFKKLEKLAKANIPTLAIFTTPDYKAVRLLSQFFNFMVFGWDEDLLAKDAKRFNDVDAFSGEEMYFPVLEPVLLPEDDYHQKVNLAWAALSKSRSTRRLMGLDDPNLDRTFAELSKVIHELTNLAFSIDTYCASQVNAGYVPLDKRMQIVRGLIGQLPKKLNQILELENVVNLCQAALQQTPTKQKFYEERLEASTVHFVAVPDAVTQSALAQQFARKRGLNILTPDTKDQIRKSQVILNGLSGRLESDYKLIKSIKAEKLVILLYASEKKALENLLKSREDIKEMLSRRKQVLEALHIEKP